MEFESQHEKERLGEQRQEEAYFLQSARLARQMMVQGTSSVTFHMAGAILEALEAIMKEQLGFYRKLFATKKGKEHRRALARYHRPRTVVIKKRLKLLKKLREDYFRRLKIRIDLHELDK